jgi:prepilin signal peptidase PulO-like enzyme (type II secretory pathway)
MINLEIVILVLAGVAGFYIPLLGKALLTYRQIPLPNVPTTSPWYALFAMIGIGLVFSQEYMGLKFTQAAFFYLLLLLISWMDAHTGYILDQLTCGGAFVLLLFQCFIEFQIIPIRLLVAMICYGLLYLVVRQGKLGLGDVKLLAMCALVLEWTNLMFAIWIASISGLLFVFWRGKNYQVAFPFGPHVSFGVFFSYLFGDAVLSTLLTHILY